MRTARVRIECPTASRRRTGWTKLVTSVDKSKSNGYAFEGEWLDDGEYDLPVGAVVIAKAPGGSRSRPYDIGLCYRVTEDGLVQTNEDAGQSWEHGHNWRESFLTFRDHVAEQLALMGDVEPTNPLAEYSDDEILAEARRRGLIGGARTLENG